MSKNEIQLNVNRSALVFFIFGGIVTAIVLNILSIRYSAKRHVITIGKEDIKLLALSNINHPPQNREWPVSTKAAPKQYVDPALKGEILAALHQALDAKHQGKKEKAYKLFRHALALDPYHVDTLVEYGEFLEEEDVLQADHYYTCALLINGSNTKALSNIRRTSHVVEEIDTSMLQKIDKKWKEIFGKPHNIPAMQRARQEFYYLQIYHTTAIEGNTLSLEQMRSILENGLAIGGKSILEHNEVLGLNLALEFINNTLLNTMGDITVRDILEIHRRVLGHVDPLEAGQIRTSQVFIGGHVPPPSTEVEDMMDDFVLWLNSEETLQLHPVELAALAHYKFVYIHPFLDGNGRTARLLMNLILMRAGYPPIIIKLAQRPYYYETIKQANMGDIRPFIRLIANSLDEMLDAYHWVAGDSHTTTIQSIDNDEKIILS